mmetsp:Transcript_20032/g.35263  ORF Transcript_20032/g.35263 Transcript_20032/m.35263 type:complete len:209 (+) Transcript_20032:691-1317(+)
MGPASISVCLELLVKDICGEYGILQNTRESFLFRLVVTAADAIHQVLKFGLHQVTPGKVKGVILSYTLVVVNGCNSSSLFDQLIVGNTCVINVVDQSSIYDSELGQGTGCNVIRVFLEVAKVTNFAVRSFRLFTDSYFLGWRTGAMVHTREHFHATHGHVGGMFKVVERVLPVHGCNSVHMLLQLFNDLRINLIIAISLELDGLESLS